MGAPHNAATMQREATTTPDHLARLASDRKQSERKFVWGQFRAPPFALIRANGRPESTAAELQPSDSLSPSLANSGRPFTN